MPAAPSLMAPQDSYCHCLTRSQRGTAASGTPPLPNLRILHTVGGLALLIEYRKAWGLSVGLGSQYPALQGAPQFLLLLRSRAVAAVGREVGPAVLEVNVYGAPGARDLLDSYNSPKRYYCPHLADEETDT